MGRLDDALSRHDIIAVDTVPFIYFWEQHPRYFRLSESVFRRLKQPGVQGVTSIITLIEACVLPHRQGRLDLVRAYEHSLLCSPQVRVLLIDADLARRAIDLRARYAIHVPDALQLAAGLESGATAFVTNDRRLAQVRETQVLLLDDYTT